MSFTTDLIGVGVTPEEATVLRLEEPVSAPARKVSLALTATGSAIGDALQLTSFVHTVGTAAASTGVKLASTWPIGQFGLVQNNGANALNLYPPTASIKINGGTDGAAVTIAAAAANLIVRYSATDFGVFVLAKEA